MFALSLAVKSANLFKGKLFRPLFIVSRVVSPLRESPRGKVDEQRGFGL